MADKKKKKPEAEEEDEEEEAGGGKKKIMMIVGGVVALGAVYNFVLKKPAEDPAATAAAPAAVAAADGHAAEAETATASHGEAAAEEEGEIVPMEEMILNLAGPEGTYLKISLALVLDLETLAEEFELEVPIAQDVAVQYLSAQTPDKFKTPEGRELVKEELTDLVIEAYHGKHVLRVLITSLVMQ